MVYVFVYKENRSLLFMDVFVHWYSTVSDVILLYWTLHDNMHFRLQDGWTALMKASKAGHMESMKVLLDNSAQVNMQDKVCDVIIHCVPAMLHVTRVPSSA